MSEKQAQVIEVIPTGSIALDMSLGIGGIPQRLYNAPGRLRDFRTFWADYQRLHMQTFDMKWRR